MADTRVFSAGKTLAPFITALREAIDLKVNTYEVYYFRIIWLSNLRTCVWQIFIGYSPARKSNVTFQIKLLALRASN